MPSSSSPRNPFPASRFFGRESVEAGEFVRDRTEADAVFLTGTQHLNPVFAIGGKTVVCGPDLWLYYHGLNTAARQRDISVFYADPENNTHILEKYGVDYILVSSYERSDYDIDQEGLLLVAEEVFSNREGTIYRVKEAD